MQGEAYEPTVRLPVQPGEDDAGAGSKRAENLLVGEVADAVEEDSDDNSDDEDGSGDDGEGSNNEDGGNDDAHKTDDIDGHNSGDKSGRATRPSYAHKVAPMIASVMSAAQRMLVPGKR